MSREARWWAGDALVVGAGASGVLAARHLAERGLEVTLVEAVGFGAEQSNHSHGYMHRGHIYISPSRELVDVLGRGAEAWQADYTRLKLPFLLQNAHVGFVNSLSDSSATSRWRTCALEFDACDPPTPFVAEQFVSFYETREVTIEATGWFKAVKDQDLRGVRLVRAQALRVLRDAAGAVGVEVVGPTLGRAELLAGATVLTCGVGNLELATSAAVHRGRAVNRTSYMLVLTGSALPRLSAIIPEHETYGLFLASRSSDAETVWIISNYVSFSGGLNSPRAAALWARSISRTVHRITNVFDNADLAWDIYPAPKGEVRFDRRSLNRHVVENFGVRHLFVGSPTKLTLAPLLAMQLAHDVPQETLRHRPRGVSRVEIADHLPVIPERWTMTRRRPIAELLELVRDPVVELAPFI